MRLKDVRDPARVRRMLGNGRIEVEAGFMKMQVSVDDVIEVLPERPAAASKLPKNVSYRPAPELAPVHQEINVIGQRAEEARDAVDQFLDRAVMATASRVRIVHGHGMGILKQDHRRAAEPAIRTWRGSTRPRSRKAARERPSWSCGSERQPMWRTLYRVPVSGTGYSTPKLSCPAFIAFSLGKPSRISVAGYLG